LKFDKDLRNYDVNISKFIKFIRKDYNKMKGKVAVITASSTGIGKGIALRLAQDGCSVIISSRDQKNVNETVNELKSQGYEAYGIVCHVGKK